MWGWIHFYLCAINLHSPVVLFATDCIWKHHHIFCWVLKFAYDMPAYLWIVAHIMNAHSLDTLKKKTAPSFGWTLPHNLFHLKISYHNGSKWRNVTTGVNWKVMVSNWNYLCAFAQACRQTFYFQTFIHEQMKWSTSCGALVAHKSSHLTSHAVLCASDIMQSQKR